MGADTDVVIFGTGSLAVLAHTYLTADSDFRPIAFAVDAEYLDRNERLGLPVVAAERLLETYPPDRASMLVAVGYRRVNRGRIEVYQRCKDMGYRCITYVNSSVFRWPNVDIGDNTFIFEAVVLQPFVKIGSNCVLWSGCQILHESVIEDHCFVGSQAVIGGNVTVGAASFIGLNATIRDHLRIAPSSVIGAGALIKKHTTEGGVYPPRSTEIHPSKVSSDLDDL